MSTEPLDNEQQRKGIDNRRAGLERRQTDNVKYTSLSRRMTIDRRDDNGRRKHDHKK